MIITFDTHNDGTEIDIGLFQTATEWEEHEKLLYELYPDLETLSKPIKFPCLAIYDGTPSTTNQAHYILIYEFTTLTQDKD